MVEELIVPLFVGSAVEAMRGDQRRSVADGPQWHHPPPVPCEIVFEL